MDIPIILERLTLQGRLTPDDQWGSNAFTGATYAQFASKWIGPSPVPSQVEIDTTWSQILAEGGLEGIEANNIKQRAKQIIDELKVDGRLLRAIVVGIIDTILPAINQLRQNPTTAFPQISRQQAIETTKNNIRSAIDSDS